MRTFFYSTQKAGCDGNCHYQECSKRYLARMRMFSSFEGVQPIYGEISYDCSGLDILPRNGDIVVLYAETARQLDNIIKIRDGFDGLRKILVVAASVGVDANKYHMLAPRFITQSQRDINELDAVVKKMKEQFLH